MPAKPAAAPAPVLPIAATATAAPTPPTAPGVPANTTNTPDLLEARIAATLQWLARQNDAAWTLQTLSTTSEDDLRNHLRFLTKTIEINNIYVYRKLGTADQKPVLSVLFGTYDDRAAAERVLAQLPAQMKSNQPWPRTVQSIRAEIR